jgi:hypothetical protein
VGGWVDGWMDGWMDGLYPWKRQNSYNNVMQQVTTQINFQHRKKLYLCVCANVFFKLNAKNE